MAVMQPEDSAPTSAQFMTCMVGELRKVVDELVRAKSTLRAMSATPVQFDRWQARELRFLTRQAEFKAKELSEDLEDLTDPGGPGGG